MDYQKAYYTLSNAMTDAIDTLTKEKDETSLALEVKQAVAILQVGQRITEDMYIESEENAMNE